MEWLRNKRWYPVIRLGIAIVTLGTAGCDSILGTNQAAFADEARVIVDGESATPLHLVTSTNFTARRNIDTDELEVDQLLASDTAAVNSLPFERTYAIRGADRFMIRLVNPDLNVTATVRIRMFLDDRLVFDQRATMRDASLQYIAYYDPSS